MNLVVPFKFKNETFNVSISQLEEVLKKASKDVSYKPHISGFKLTNDVLRLEYDRWDIGQEDVISLWLLQVNPKVRLRGNDTKMTKIPGSIKCNYITGHTGDTWSCVLPQEKDEIGNTITIKRDPALEDLPGYMDYRLGCEQWFKKSTEILQYAAKKYGLKGWFNKYCGGRKK